MVSEENASVFDLDEFLSRSGPQLWEYLPAKTRLTVPAPVVRQIIDRLDSLDEEHLLYALEISCDYEGDAFTPLIPQYLAHTSKAVRLAASRKLQHLDHVSKDVFELVKKFIPQFPECRDEWLELVSNKIR